MHTIHIHTTNADDIGDIVTNLMRHFTGLSITIDQPPTAAARIAEFDQGLVAARAANPPKPTKTATPVATKVGPARIIKTSPVVATVIDVENAEKARRAAAKDRYIAKYWDDLVSTPCRDCRALAHESCMTAKGMHYGRSFVHNVRVIDRMNRNAKAATPVATKAVVLDEVFSEYCQCGHGAEVHDYSYDHEGHSCSIHGCSCANLVLIPASTDKPVM